MHRELTTWPYLCNIEGVEAKLGGVCFFRVHNLDLGRPRDFFFALDSFPEVLLAVVWVYAAHFNRLLGGELLLVLVADEVVFVVDKLTVRIDPFEGVAAVAVVEAPAFGMTVVGEEHHAGVVVFWGVAKQIEGSAVVEQEGVGTTRLRSDDIRTLNGITAEEDGPVKADDMIVSFTSIELDCENHEDFWLCLEILGQE